MNHLQGLFRRPFWQTSKPSRRNPRSLRSILGVEHGMASEVELLEERLVLSPGILAIGVDAGSQARVSVYDSASGTPLYEFNPYADLSPFFGGVRTAVGYTEDANGNPGFPVIITAPGPGLSIPNPASPGPVRVYSAVAGTLLGGVSVEAGRFLTSLNPYPGFGGGIYVASADFNLDGFSEVVTGADAGGGPHVKIISLALKPNSAVQVLFSQFAYDAGFRGGVRVATGDVNFDGVPDLITGAGLGGGPNIHVYSGATYTIFPGAAGDFFAYPAGFTGGVYVAAGDFNPSGNFRTGAEIVTGAGAGGGPNVRIIPFISPNPNDPTFDLNRSTTAFPFSVNYTGGVRVAAAYVDNDFAADLIVATGYNAEARIVVYSGPSANVIYTGPSFANPTFVGGSFPSSGKFIGEPQRLDAQGSTPPATATQITQDELTPLVHAALARYEQAGVPPDILAQLGTVQFLVGNLPGNLLGLAEPGVVILDDDAAGFGWFIDPTPTLDEEFDTYGHAIALKAQGHADLFTVILHELGHQLGLGDLDPATNPNHLMTEGLTLGQRLLPERSVIEMLFSGDTLIDHLMAPALF